MNNTPKKSFYQCIKTNAIVQIKYIITVFFMFATMIVATGGKTSSGIVMLTYIVGTIYIILSEINRDTKSFKLLILALIIIIISSVISIIDNDISLSVINQHLIRIINRYLIKLPSEEDIQRQWLFAAWRIWLTHAAIWLAFIFAYPKSPQIQAIFFWNPWVRRIIGLGYVGFLITWIPFFRSRLFIPFKKSLLADAKLDYSDLEFYFDTSEVKHEASGKVQPLKQAIPKIKGQIILQGESGLGKSLFLRHLAKDSQRIVVYLSADRCTDGVIKAIQNKLLGKARDFNFLRDLIYSGSIDICLDGLNEVNADTRATIKEFVERYFKGNIIMTTQPLEWKPPTTASTYTLQPLQDDLIREFLLSRQSSLAEDNQLQIQNYPQACQDYLAKALNQNLSEEELKANKNILSNPMDLNILGQVIAPGEEPDLFRLQQQQYELMAADYEAKLNEKFPLDKFSQHAYQIRLNNSTISETDFLEELHCMLRHKMVICQQFRNVKDENVTEWKFRHDKIWEFFILQTFLGKDNELPNQHKNDPRFRGVYFLLANLLPLNEAEILREDLIRYAANTGDHTVSDRFIQILLTRQ